MLRYLTVLLFILASHHCLQAQHGTSDRALDLAAARTVYYGLNDSTRTYRSGTARAFSYRAAPDWATDSSALSRTAARNVTSTRCVIWSSCIRCWTGGNSGSTTPPPR